MQELRFVAVSEDGSYAVLAIPGRSGRFILPIDERLRAVALGQASRLAQYEIEVESPLRPKEIQARIRAGETAEEIADAAGIPVERVRWFEGPVLAERGYIADQAQAGSVRRAGDSSGPGPRLGDIVTARLSASGSDPADGQWDSRKRGDGNWQVSLTFPSGGRLHVAEWVFDPRRRHVMPDDDNAARLCLPESELPPEPVSVPGEATVTPIASRLGAAAGMGGGGVSTGYAAPGGSRFRPERSVIPDRSLGADRSLADRPLPPPVPADRPAVPERPAMPGQHDRPGYQERPAAPGYAEFPESAPFRAPESRAAEPRAPQYRPQHRAPGSAYGEPSAQTAAYRPPSVEPAGRTQEPEPATYRAQEPEPATYRAQEAESHSYEDLAPQSADYFAGDSKTPDFRESAPARNPAPEVNSAAPASAGDRFADDERGVVTPPREVVFDEPEPTAASAIHAPGAAAAPASQPARAPLPDTNREVTPAPAMAAPASAAEPKTRTAMEQATVVEQASTAMSAAAAATAAGTAAAGPAKSAASVPRAEMPATAVPQPAAPVTPEPRAEVPATAEPAAADQASAESVAAEQAAADDQQARPRAGAKKNAKARRSSVPSWDEIMLGSSRQRD
jgi:Protein of unknown function (DUF3071)